jgi:hypothetical protein
MLLTSSSHSDPLSIMPDIPPNTPLKPPSHLSDKQPNQHTSTDQNKAQLNQHQYHQQQQQQSYHQHHHYQQQQPEGHDSADFKVEAVPGFSDIPMSRSPELELPAALQSQQVTTEDSVIQRSSAVVPSTMSDVVPSTMPPSLRVTSNFPQQMNAKSVDDESCDKTSHLNDKLAPRSVADHQGDSGAFSQQTNSQSDLRTNNVSHDHRIMQQRTTDDQGDSGIFSQQISYECLSNSFDAAPTKVVNGSPKRNDVSIASMEMVRSSLTSEVSIQATIDDEPAVKVSCSINHISSLTTKTKNVASTKTIERKTPAKRKAHGYGTLDGFLTKKPPIPVKRHGVENDASFVVVIDDDEDGGQTSS